MNAAVEARLTPEHIPDEVKRMKRFVLWRWEPREGGKLTKVPIRIDCEQARPEPVEIDVTNPDNWMTFEDALNVLLSWEDVPGVSPHGLGFCPGEGVVAIDLDDCRDPHTGAIARWASEIVDAMRSYTEVSPSGTGLRIIVRTTKPAVNRSQNVFDDSGRKIGKIEVLAEKRFATITGRRLEEFPDRIEERTNEVHALLERLNTYGSEYADEKDLPPEPSKEEMKKRAWEALEKIKSRDQEKLREIVALGSEENSEDRSGTAFRLACLLAECGVADRLTIACAVRLSTPHAEKFIHENRRDGWKEAWRVAGRALEKVKTEGRIGSALTDDGLPVVCLADVQPEEVEWVWHPYVPLKKLTILAGDPGLGKTWVALALAAFVSGGQELIGPDGTIWTNPNPGNVLYLAAEDGLEDTIVPRLKKVGADLRRVHALNAGIDLSNDEWRRKTERTLTKLRPRLVVIDPMQSFIGANVDTRQANEVRQHFLSYLVDLARRYECAVLLVTHLRKASSDRAIYKVMGSIDFVAAARSVLVVEKDPNDKDRRIMAHAKSSLAPTGDSLSFRIWQDRFEWDSVVDVDADTLAAEGGGQARKSALDMAANLLRDMLYREGPMEKQECIQRVKATMNALGYDVSEETIRKAKQKAGVLNMRDSHDRKKSLWYVLPENASDFYRQGRSEEDLDEEGIEDEDRIEWV